MTFWGGLRGALSVALALSIVGYKQIDAQVPVVAYGIVVLSLLVQGGLLLPVARFLGLSVHTGTSESAARRAREHTRPKSPRGG